MEKVVSFEIEGEVYNLVAKRSLIISLKKVIPEIVNLKTKKDIDDVEVDVAIKLYDNMNVIFYEMLKIKHPEINKDASDTLFDKFCNKYGNAEESLIELMSSVFQLGIPNTEKQNLNWF